MTPTEAVAKAAIIRQEQEQKVHAKRAAYASHARIAKDVREGRRPESDLTKLPPVEKIGRRTRQIVSQAVGMNEYQLRNAEAIVQAAKDDPGRFGDLPAQMDRTLDIGAVYSELQRRRDNGGAEPRVLVVDKAERAIRAAITSLDGLASGLDMVEHAEEIPAETRAALSTEILRIQKRMRRFVMQRLGGRRAE